MTTTYAFRVAVEPDEDKWHAFCPVLEAKGAATWGLSRKEALRHIEEVVQMVVEELIQDGEAIPQEPKEEVYVFAEPRVAVTI